jgi:hypothetical protein
MLAGKDWKDFQSCFEVFRKIQYRFSNFLKNYFSKNGQPLIAYPIIRQSAEAQVSKAAGLNKDDTVMWLGEGPSILEVTQAPCEVTQGPCEVTTLTTMQSILKSPTPTTRSKIPVRI